MRPRRVAIPAATALAALAAGAALAACGGGGNGGLNDNGNGGTTRTVVSIAQPAAAASGAGAAGLQNAFEQTIRNVSPSVVQIETNEGLGSGIVFDDKGDIVTNNHVVGSAKSFQVTLSDGSRHSASLVGTFAPDDLAVIHLQGAAPPAAAFGNSSQLAVGELALALGNPLGLRSSVTEGIVSSLGRTVSEGSNGVVIASAIQTSAAINPGNSGGALVNLNSQVIGIPTLAATDPQLGGGAAPGIGFAIPSNTVKNIATQLIDHGHVTNSGRAFLDVEVATSLMGNGVVVASAAPGGPAARAGIARGDVIVSVDGQPVQTTDDLSTVLAGLKPGQSVPVVILTPSGRRTVHVTLGQSPG